MRNGDIQFKGESKKTIAILDKKNEKKHKKISNYLLIFIGCNAIMYAGKWVLLIF